MENEIICVCMDVRRGVIAEVVKERKLTTVDEVGDITEAGTSCGACHEEIEQIIRETNHNN